jgi:FlgD Ig-like domain
MSYASPRSKQSDPSIIAIATLTALIATILGTTSLAFAAVPPPSVHVDHEYGVPYGGRAIQIRITFARADSVWVEPVIGPLTAMGTGSRVFSVVFNDTTTVRAYARNEAGTAFDELVIRALRPKIEFFNAWPEATPPGGGVLLNANFRGATAARIDPQVGPIYVSPYGMTDLNKKYSATIESATVFTLTVSNPVGIVTMTDTVFVAPPFIDDLTAAPDEIVPGESTRIDWTVYFADDLRVFTDGSEVLSSQEFPFGSMIVNPRTTTDYVLEATNIGGTSRDTVRVSVSPVIIRNFETEQPITPPNYPVWLKWTIAGVGEAVLEGIGSVDLHDSVLVHPEDTQTYVLSARAGSYVTTKSLTVEVSYSPPDFIALSWESDSVPGQRLDIAAGEEFDVYVLALSPSLGLYAYEFGLDLPSGFVLVESVAFPEGASVNVVDQPSWVVGTGSCYGRFEDYVPLLRATLRYDGGSKLPATANLSITGSTPSTFVDGEPGFYDCAEQLRSFQILEVFDLMKPSIRVPILSYGLEVDRIDQGIRVRWQLNSTGSFDVLEVVRRGSGGGESVLVHYEGDSIPRVGSWVDQTKGLDSASYKVRVRIDDVWVESEAQAMPTTTALGLTRLLPNIPNPFNPSTSLRFALERREAVRLELFDLAGRRVVELRTAPLDAGEHSVVWDGRDQSGRPVSSGVYLVRMRTETAQDERRILLLK